MSYTTIHTKHNVGDVVFFYDSDSDRVQRGVVTSVEARCTQAGSGYSAKWDVLYTIVAKYANDPPRMPYLIGEDFVHDSPASAWPDIVVPDEVPA